MEGESGMIDLEGGVDLTDQVNHVPCCIKYDGPSPVSDYFKPKSIGIQVDGLTLKEAYLRGRKLQGTTLPLPHGYCGFVIERKASAKTKRKASADMGASWQVNAKFQNVTVWNHYKLPSKDDAFQRAFHWFDVANALHKPVKAEDMDSVSNHLAAATD